MEKLFNAPHQFPFNDTVLQEKWRHFLSDSN